MSAAGSNPSPAAAPARRTHQLPPVPSSRGHIPRLRSQLDTQDHGGSTPKVLSARLHPKRTRYMRCPPGSCPGRLRQGEMAEGRRVKPLFSGAALQNNGILGLFVQLGLDPREQTPSHAEGPLAAGPTGVLPLERCPLPCLRRSSTEVDRGLLLPQPWSSHLHMQGRSAGCQPPSGSTTPAPSRRSGTPNPKTHLNYLHPFT